MVKNPFDNRMKKSTRPLKAIRYYCMNCCLDQPREIELCASDGEPNEGGCPLHPFRFGRNPSGVRGTKTATKAIRRYCITTCCETSTEVRNCSDEDCSLVPFRRGKAPSKKRWGVSEAEKGVSHVKLDTLPPENFKKTPIAGIVLTVLFLLYTQLPANAATGTASYYTAKSCYREARDLGLKGDYWGKLTASGEPYREDGFTCAARDWKFGTRLRVRNIKNNKCVVVVVNDFGPSKRLHAKGRIIDLTPAAFRKLAGSLGYGVIHVEVTPL